MALNQSEIRKTEVTLIATKQSARLRVLAPQLTKIFWSIFIFDRDNVDLSCAYSVLGEIVSFVMWQVASDGVYCALPSVI